MKTKLYHKVLKMAWKELAHDPRPSVNEVYLDIYQPRLDTNNKTIIITPKREIDARAAYVVWTKLLSKKIYGNKLRYNLSTEIKSKYAKYKKRYWSDEQILYRIICTGNEK